jgi:hypothetical protein
MFLRNVGATRATLCNIPEDGILHSHRHEILKSYIYTISFRIICLYKIRGFHGGEYEKCRLMGCDAVWFVRTNVSEERRFLQVPHGVTSQKTAFFIYLVSQMYYKNMM